VRMPVINKRRPRSISLYNVEEMNERPAIVTSDDAVEVFRKGDLVWSLTIADLVFVGEYTISSFGDDYFFEFITVKNGQWRWFEVTFYADGRTEAIAALGKNLGQPLSLGLCNSTRCKSRAMWPPELAGKPYRTLVPYKSRWDALKRSLKFQGQDYTLSRELISYVGSKCQRTSGDVGGS
jgi:hypothetical protein